MHQETATWLCIPWSLTLAESGLLMTMKEEALDVFPRPLQGHVEPKDPERSDRGRPYEIRSTRTSDFVARLSVFRVQKPTSTTTTHPSSPAQSPANVFSLRRARLSQVPRGPAHEQNQRARGQDGVKEADAVASTTTPHHPHRAPRRRCVLPHACLRAFLIFDCVRPFAD